MMMVPAYVSCSESSGFVTSLYALTQFNTNELTLIGSHCSSEAAPSDAELKELLRQQKVIAM